jgi:hypothetical protein
VVDKEAKAVAAEGRRIVRPLIRPEAKPYKATRTLLVHIPAAVGVAKEAVEAVEAKRNF